ncbi:MAG: nucleotidyl transferase AbiEii/AbiGii toxin family protein [Bacteroidetes bacterium]|nr:nucleotidyl transferase AbiEii/AbiGii toxin family protein [Bacteroidota bacterium]
MLHYETVVPGTLGLLKKLAALKELSEFDLVGGTALALLIGKRFSDDLDFFINKDFDESNLLSKLNEKFHVKVNGLSKNSLNLIINDVKVDILSHQYPKINRSKTLEGIKFSSLEDISAMKVNAITIRGSKKDFFDVYFLLNRFSLINILTNYQKKYPDVSLTMVYKSLIYFDDAENDLNPKVIEPIKWINVKKRIEIEVKKTF